MCKQVIVYLIPQNNLSIIYIYMNIRRERFKRLYPKRLEKAIWSIRSIGKLSEKSNPYIILESNPNDDIQSIRKKYIKLSKEHHPDLLMSKGVPKEVIEESKRKMRAINSAWDQIQKLKSN